MLDGPRDDATVLFDTVEMLLREKLYQSAEIVGGILLSRASLPSQQVQRDGGLHAEALSMFADALKGRGEHKRATMYYKQSLQHRKLRKEIALAGGPGTGATMAVANAIATTPLASRSILRSAESFESGDLMEGRGDEGKRRGMVGATYGVRVRDECWADRRRRRRREAAAAVGVEQRQTAVPLAELKYMEAQCLIAAGEPGAAIASLESVAKSARTAEMSATLAKVYETSGLRRNATNVYRQTLRENPLAVETIVPLLEMGVSGDEVLGIIDESLSKIPGGISRSELPWLTLYVNGHASSCACKPTDTLANFARLEHLYPTNLGALLQVAKAHMDLDQWDEALGAFKKARLVDDMNVDMMDCYGVVMRQKSMPSGLNRLANELLSTDARRAETWVVMALYSEVRGDKEKAAAFVDKALELKANYALAHILKGSLVLSEGKYEAAPKFFLHANNIRKDIYSYKGLVNAYLQAGKLREAGFAAKEANQMMPGDARTVLLTGNVLEHMKGMRDSKEKAKLAYEKALRIDPFFLDATMALVALHLEDRNYEACIQLLLKAVGHHTRDSLHTKLAEVYTLNEQYDDALESFHFAISLNPTCPNAARGLERLEKLMRGVDPDEDVEADGAGEGDAAGETSASYGGAEYSAASPTY